MSHYFSINDSGSTGDAGRTEVRKWKKEKKLLNKKELLGDTQTSSTTY